MERWRAAEPCGVSMQRQPAEGTALDAKGVQAGTGVSSSEGGGVPQWETMYWEKNT